MYGLLKRAIARHLLILAQLRVLLEQGRGILLRLLWEVIGLGRPRDELIYVFVHVCWWYIDPWSTMLGVHLASIVRHDSVYPTKVLVLISLIEWMGL